MLPIGRLSLFFPIIPGMVTFTEPTAGMFIWLKINGIRDTRKLIYEKALGQEVLLLPGSAFFWDQSQSYPFVRVSYSLCTPEQIETVDERCSSTIGSILVLSRAWLGSVPFFAKNYVPRTVIVEIECQSCFRTLVVRRNKSDGELARRAAHRVTFARVFVQMSSD